MTELKNCNKSNNSLRKKQQKLKNMPREWKNSQKSALLRLDDQLSSNDRLTFRGSRWDWENPFVLPANGHPSNASVQTKSATGASVTTLSPTLAAFAGATDVAYGVFGVASATAVIAAGTGFTTVDQQPSGEGTVGDLLAEWAVNRPAVTATWPSANAGGLAVEVKAAP